MSHPLTSAVRSSARTRRNHPMAWAIAVALGTVVAPASQAQQAFSPAWFAERGAAQGAATQTGRMPTGAPIQFQVPVQQQDAARQKLQQSIDNLGTAAQAIALQQRLQEQARQVRRDAGFIVADGLGRDGLKVDENPLTRGWANAREAIQSQGSDGRVQVSIEQTADKAILNWETFNIGSNTTLTFLQNADWAVLNRVNDPNARPSQILGQLNAGGTVFVANRNGVIFGNNSQVNVRNLLAAAARISDGQFRDNGLYSSDANTAALSEAFGKVVVEQGARISTQAPGTATRGGGYVLLAGHSVENAGQIETDKGQTQLAAGDSFVIRRGVGTAANTSSTTRGNEIAPRFVAGSTAGGVRNTGLILAREGDITLAGRTVEQAGVAVATSTLNQRGTVHLLTSASDRQGSVTLASGATTAVLIEDDGKTTVLDSQRDALIKESAEQDVLRTAANSGTFDNLSRQQDRRDQSRVEIVSGGDIHFRSGSLTLATGGQIIADATARTGLADGARVDVSGAVGVRVAMESNNVKVKVQGNELRDSPDNRDSTALTGTEVWIDRRQLIHVPGGTGGHEADRWYAGGGLLEVGGYLDNQGHSIGEWAAQGGTVLLGGNEVVTQAGSRINLAGGSLDVQSGVIQQSWLRGVDGGLYRLDDAPAEMLFNGLYSGYEVKQARWGITEAFRNPLIAASQRVDNGYTVGRDAGRLVVSAPTAVLQGQVDTQTFQGAQQGRRADAALEGYAQAQTAVARNAQLWLGRYDANGRAAVFNSDVRLGGLPKDTPAVSLQAPLPEGQRNTVWLDDAQLSAQQWGRIDLATSGSVAVQGQLRLQAGGQLNLMGSNVDVAGDIRIVGGQLQLGNLLDVAGRPTALLRDGHSALRIADGAHIDLAGGWSNALLGPDAEAERAWIDGGSLRMRGSHDVSVGNNVVVNLDAGGALDAKGKGRVGKGGSASLLANASEVSTDGSGRVRLGTASTFSALGQGSGAFALATGGKVAITDGAAADALRLSTALFGSGFSQYDINGHQGLEVADGTVLQVALPGLRLADAARTAGDRQAALQAWLAPLYGADPLTGRVSQRGGASITLRSDRNFVSGDVRIGKGAQVLVDPGQSIVLRGAADIRVEGTLQAQGGRIALEDAAARNALLPGQRSERTWRIGEGAVLDVSGDAAAIAEAGTVRGQVRKGGQIEIGGALDWEGEDAKARQAPAAFVVIERGAALRARGASAELDIAGKGRTRVDSDGGSIVLSSANALYLDGEMDAAAGGSGARGGTLGVALLGLGYAPNATSDVLAPRYIALSQQGAAASAGPLAYGHAALSVAQIQAGGFDHLSLFGDVRAAGDVTLRMDQSLRLYGSIGMLPGAAAGSQVSLQAPYLRFAQALKYVDLTENKRMPVAAPLASGNGYRLAAQAELIDIRDANRLDGFDQVDLRSSGDVRMLAPVIDPTGVSELAAPGVLDVTARRLYPATLARGRLVAGASLNDASLSGTWTNPDGLLRIHGTGGAAPAAPDSAFGSLELLAATVQQGGAVFAPWGRLQIGGRDNNSNRAGTVTLLPGSITSVSGAGLRLPFGGTVDGVGWQFNGAAFDPQDLRARGLGLEMIGNQIDVAAGAVLDLSGGGELQGGAFVSGRGGSVDIRRTALADANPRYGFSSSGSEVYAIVPGKVDVQAPAGLADRTRDPRLGQQITVPAGVPGLPPGTYTLLPASFALQPGAFRVELGATGTTGVAGAVATGTGSWRLSGHQGQALGGATSPLLTDLLITPAEVVRRHSGYNETSYNAFVQSTAERRGEMRSWQTVDAGNVTLRFGAGAGREGTPALSAAGTMRTGAGTGGLGSTLAVVSNSSSTSTLEIIGSGGTATAGLQGVTVFDSALNALQPSRLLVGGALVANPGGFGIEGIDRSVTVRSGAALRAGEVLLAGTSGGTGILVEAGATIDTLGLPSPFGTAQTLPPYLVTGGLLAVSNNRLNVVTAGGASSVPVAIDIGGCRTQCAGDTRLVSDGSISIATDGALQIRDGVSYGTRQLGLSMSTLNLGSNEAIAAAAAAGGLPQGMTLNQGVLQQLLRGNTAIGAPALDTLSLTAAEAINVFGSVDLDTRDSATGHSSLRSLVLGAPAIHGYGAAGDRARIFADTLVWDGTRAGNQLPGSEQTQAPGEAMVGRLGSGTLDIVTRTLELGRAPFSRPSSSVPADRRILGFAGVNLTASERMLFSGKGSLDVYQTQGSYVAGEGWQYSGGGLDITTPLLTGAAGSQLAVRTGGTFALHGADANTGNDALGAELSIKADRITLDSQIALASGRLEATARQGVTLGAQAVVDVAGRKVSLFDVDKYSWGGDVLLSSAEGDVRTDAASRIDLSARNNRGGRLSVTAQGAQGGQVDLAGTVLGSASGRYDAGGTVVPYDAAELIVRARQLQDFSGLNQRLNSTGVTGGRTFQLGEGDLVIGDEVKARRVDISVDGGSLHVNGRIDASGEQVGSIRLSARDLLRVDGALDAHGSGLRVDSYGKIIDSPNRATIDLNSASGGIALGAGSSMDLRAGTDVSIGSRPGQNDGRDRGTLRLNLPRAGSNDALVDVATGVRIRGAADIQVNGFRTYDNAPLASAPDVHGNRPQVINQRWLDTVVDPDNSAWMNAALANAGLQERMAALGSYRLRPGVQIVARSSADNPRGDLVVSGDIDLSGYRYGPQANRFDAARRGFGESAALVLRAQGDINVYGSINDGFAPPPANPDEGGWVLIEGRTGNAAQTAFGGDLVVPNEGVQLQPGTEFRPGVTLNYALPFQATTLPAGTVLPADMTLSGQLVLAAGSVLGAAVTTADGQVLAAGTVLPQALTLQAGARLGAGFRLRSAVAVAAQTWPAGVVLPVALRLARALDLRAGSIIPSMTKVELAGDAPVKLRPADASGNQGRNWALAAMLPEGTTSWDLTAVAGADTAAADPRTRRWGSAGSIVLADSHYTTIGTVKVDTEWRGDKVVSEQGSIDYWGDTSYAGKPVKEFLEVVGGTEDDFCAAGPYCLPAPRLVDKQGSLDYWGDESYVGTSAKDFAEMNGMTEAEFCALAANYCYGGGSLTEVTTYGKRIGAPAWSVLRTGKGDLELLAARDVVMKSAFGVYTAGAPTQLGNGRDAAFNPARAPAPWNTTLLGSAAASGNYDAALATYQAWYPDHGGNLRVEAGRDILGDVWGERAESGSEERDQADHANAAVGNWLWRQGTGSTSGVQGTPTSWWINFGTYSFVREGTGKTPRMVGFTGFGTLGGGNLTLEAGRHTGVLDAMGNALGHLPAPHSSAVVAAVGSTGRVSDGTLHLTGGGDLELRSGGALNPGLRATVQQSTDYEQNLDVNGALINLRGSLRVEASRIGGLSAVQASYGTLGALRAADPFSADTPRAMGGPVLVLGDSAATLQARGDVVLGGVGDAGRVPVANYTSVLLDDGRRAAGTSWFSLWTPNTALDLFSAGGNLNPGLVGSLHVGSSNFAPELLTLQVGQPRTELAYWLYPSRFSAVAANGNILLSRLNGLQTSGRQDVILLAPSASGRLDVLAGGSLLAEDGATQIARSGADGRLPSPFDPAFAGEIGQAGQRERSNLSVDATGLGGGALPLFAFGPNTPLSGALALLPASPSRFYALAGDIIGLGSGAQRTLQAQGTRTRLAWFEAAAPVQLRAGRDVLGVDVTALNTQGTDISRVEAGRDIVRSNVTVAGPGNVEVAAGRQLRQEDGGSVITLGGIVQGDSRPGASVALTAGSQQIDYAAMRARYLDPANRADPGQSLAAQPGKAVKIYDEELKQWLLQRFGFSGDGTAALAYFDALPAEQQRLFLRQVYYAELREGGREYNDASGPRFGSYLRGREAIATLMPDKDARGNAIDRSGDIVMYGGSGVRTEAGGSIELLAPGGQIVVGVQGVVPPASAGLVTQGQGDIRLFSQDSVLLGLSRVMTTFGGDVLAWSEQGDINAGRGARTTLLYTPPRRLYDNWGNVRLSPQAPVSGAGIATLNPIAEVAPGDVDLIAPLGTIDAGEAGIRVSGNINLAALQVLNAANIQVQGESRGLPVLATVNVNALASASAAAGSASQAAQDVMRKSQDDARRNQPSVISVQVLGFGGRTGSVEPAAQKARPFGNYDPDSAFQFPQAVEPQARLDKDGAKTR